MIKYFSSLANKFFALSRGIFSEFQMWNVSSDCVFSLINFSLPTQGSYYYDHCFTKRSYKSDLFFKLSFLRKK